MKKLLWMIVGGIIGSCTTMVAAGYMYVDAYRKTDDWDWRFDEFQG